MTQRDTIQNYLKYWRASLADASILSPTDSDIEQSFQVGDSDLERGIIPCAPDIWKQVDAGNKKSGDVNDLTQVCIVTRLAVTKFEHGHCLGSVQRKTWPLIIVYAMVDRTGKIIISDGCGLPYVPRDFVAPTSSEVSVVEMEDLDTFYANQVEAVDDWNASLDIIKKLTAIIADEFDGQGLVIRPGGCVIPIDKKPIPADAVIKLYDTLISKGFSDKTALPALFANGGKSSVPGIYDFHLNKMHVGQMGGEYGLSDTQRQSLLAFLEGNGDILGINGAPGTGKTTLLQSVVASEWTRAALNDAACPIIVGSSTNNQAIENIIEAFERAGINKNDPVAVKLNGRWIPDVSDFGMSMPSENARKKAQQNGKSMQVYTKHPTSAEAADHFASKFNDKVKWDEAVKHYLDRLTAADICKKLSEQTTEEILSSARSELHHLITAEILAMRELIDATEELVSIKPGENIVSISGAKQSIEDCNYKFEELETDSKRCKARHKFIESVILNFVRHRETEPLLVYILAAIGLRGKRTLRDERFLLEESARTEIVELKAIENPDRNNIQYAISPMLDDLAQNILSNTNNKVRLEKWIKTVQRAIDVWEKRDASSEKLHDECTLNDFFSYLDKTYRHRAFLLSVHYWEARFLLATLDVINGKVKENKSPQNLIVHFSRLAMLCPCFVSSMHKMPSWFTGYTKDGPSPMEGVIDLLIIDEAGQVTPEISAASFSFAKRVIAVGDTKQIEPVWGITASMDMANAEKFDIAVTEREYDDLESTGKASASGSVMKMAQRASHYSSHPDVAGGLFLLEHRRCLRPIIDYCNRMVYKGLLRPLTNETGRPKIASIPVMGYAHIHGFDKKVGKSRCNEVEAEVIAKWLLAKKHEILEKYGQDKLKDIVGIVTPFSVQAKEISKRLAAHGLGKDEITVGTVHALQGAEREMVIFSPVYSSPSSGRMFFDRSPNMLNVAVSRARDHFLMFGNMDILTSNSTSPSGLLAQMVKAGANSEIFDIFPVMPFSIPQENQILLTDLQSHRDHLINTIRLAKNEVILVSPYVTERALKADNICDEVKVATGRGVKITVLVDVASNQERNDEFNKCAEALLNSGARLYKILPKANKYKSLHSKLLWADDDIFSNGSFNWLSSPRENYADKIEHTLVVRGALCKSLIYQALKTLNPLAGESI